MKLLIAFILFPYFSFSQQKNDSSRYPNDDMHALKEVADALLNPGKTICYDTLIPDMETAIEYAELILFKVYGKEQIISERPYRIYKTRGFWYIAGTLTKYEFGGTFEIIFNSKNGNIIKLCHGK